MKIRIFIKWLFLYAAFLNISRAAVNTDIQADTNKIAESVISDFINKSAALKGNPNTLNVIIEKLLDGDNRLLRGLNLKFNNQQYGSESFLALNYSYNKNVVSNYFSESSLNSTGLNFAVSTEGNLILGNRENPNDFIKSNISFHYFYNMVGVEKVNDSIKKRKQELELLLSDYEDKIEMRNSPEYDELMKISSQFLKTQLYLDFSLVGSIESDHTFTKKQLVYGAQLGLDIKAWNIYSELSKLNFFDWPFAAVRWLNGTDKELLPLGSTIPTLLFTISAVDPVKDNLRDQLGLNKPYPRFGLEAAFKTLVSGTGESKIFFTADLRYFKEINPNDVVKKFKMDDQIYIVAAFTQEEGFFISYAYGNLPLDKKKDEVYSIGFNWKF